MTNQQPTLFLYYMTKKLSYKEIVLPLSKVSCVHRLRFMSRPHVLGVEICENESRGVNKVCIAMDNQELLHEWMDALNNNNHHNNNNHKDHTEDDHSCTTMTLWTTTYTGDVFKCHVGGDHLAVSAYKWLHVNGHLWKVVSGGGGITWGIGFDGAPYVYTGNTTTTGVSCKESNQQNMEEHYMYENQRWNPIEGYTDRMLFSDRWSWSDESGLHELSKHNYMLPSGSKWSGAEWSIDYHKGADDEGWQYALDFPR